MVFGKRNKGEKKQIQKPFSEAKLWRKLNRVAAHIGMKVAYPVVLLYYLFKSPQVPLRAKSLIVAALTYFIMPFDGLPDFIPFLGYTDDLSLLLTTLSNTIKYVSPEILEQTRIRIEQWFSNKEDSLRMEKEILKRMESEAKEKEA